MTMTKETKQKTSEISEVLSTEEVSVRRQVKDRVFTLLFSTKEAQLELYNVINQRDYTSMKNDKESKKDITLEDVLGSDFFEEKTK